MVNAQDIYHKLQVDDCESLGHEASGEVFQFLKKKKKETKPMGWEGLSGRGHRLKESVTEEGNDQAGPGKGELRAR